MEVIWRKVWSDLWHYKVRMLLAALSIILSVFAVGVIASYRLGGDFGSNWLDRWGERLAQRFFSSPYAITLANIFRRKGRLLLTQLVLIIAGTMFLTVISLPTNLIDLTVANKLERWGYDVRISFEDRQHAGQLIKLAQTIPGVEHSEVWLTQPASILKEGQQLHNARVSIRLTGISTDTIATPGITSGSRYKPNIISGRWMKFGDKQVLVVSKDTADDNGLKVGDLVTLNLNDQRRDTKWEVIGIYETVSNNNFINVETYAPLNAVYDVFNYHNRGNWLLVRTDRNDEVYLMAISNQLQTLFEGRNMNLQVQGAGTIYQDLQFTLNQYAININMLLMLAIIVAIVGGIGLMGVLSISVVERTREIGILRAIGARSQLIMSIFVLESVLQGLISWAIATPLPFLIGYPMVRLLARKMLDLDIELLGYSYSYGAAFVWLAIVLVISTLASIIPARRATQISVQESLAYV